MTVRNWKWVYENPQQAAADIDTLQLVCANIKRLLEDGTPYALAEAKELAANALKI